MGNGIRWNWSPKAKWVFVDLETTSTVDLPQCGWLRYASHPHTRLLSAAFLIDGQKHIWVPSRTSFDFINPPGVTVHYGPTVPDIVRQAADEYVWVAHNAEGFDAQVWSRLVPDCPATWCDSQPLCRAAGLPASIDDIGAYLTGKKGKSKEGVEACRLLSRAKCTNGRPVYPVGSPTLWEHLLAYNMTDVMICANIFPLIMSRFTEPEMMAVHSAINDRGVKVDVDLVTRLAACWHEVKQQAADEIAVLTGGKITVNNIRSVQQVRKWLEEQGLRVSSLRRERLEMICENPEEYLGDVDDAATITQVLQLRLMAARASDSKLPRILDYTDTDGRLRYSIQAYGAATGRFSGRGAQLQNLPRGHDGVDVDRLRDDLTPQGIEYEAKRLNVDATAVLATMTRSVFTGPFCVVDYAAIESRGVAWLASEQKLLDLYRSGADVYCDMASRIYGRQITKANTIERQVGKIVTLGCGYGMGATRFGLLAKFSRIDLEAAGTTAEKCVGTFRESYPAIVAFWRAMDTAAKKALTAGEANAGRILFYVDSGWLVMRLPSGRNIYYRDPRIEQVVPDWAYLTGEIKTVNQLSYLHPYGYRKKLYGGLLTENAVQAICRDILIDAMIRLEADGLPIVLHVHDEVLVETDQLDRVRRIMEQPPTWAAGFPIKVTGHYTPYYRKG